jgi:predicted  nucleic acid-binding Zn-ribbon protein
VSTAVAAFEVLRFEAVPAAAGVALLELDGHVVSGPVPSRPRLLVEWGGRSQELPAVVAGGGGASPQGAMPRTVWSATFAVPLESLDAPDRSFGLVPGRGAVIGLPDPDLAGGDDDRFVRLARAANDLRHRLAEASASAATADARFGEVAEERDRLAAELAAMTERAETAERAAKEIRAAGEAADEAAARARTELEQAMAEAATLRRRLESETARAEAAEAAATHERTLRDEARADVDRLHGEMAAAAEHAEELQDKLVAAEDEATAAQRELRDVRARLTALQRERARDRPPAAPHGAVPTESAPLEWDDDGGDDTDATAVLDAEPEPDADADRERFSSAEEVMDEPTAPLPVRRTIRLEPHDGDDAILPPAAVGARFIEPSTTKPPLLALTPARILVGVAVLLLVIALVVIFAGGGLV